MTENQSTFIEVAAKVIEAIPLTEILVGVVVPIMAAWISYYLAERAIRKKENNRLYIQMGLIKKELKINADILIQFISMIEEKNRIEKSLEFPLTCMKDFLIFTLERLQKIKSNYVHSGRYSFDKPIKAYLLAEELEDIENKIAERGFQQYSDEYLDRKRKEILFNLREKREKFIREITAIKDQNIYGEFESLQVQLEGLIIGDVLNKSRESADNFVLAKYIYDKIKNFNDKSNKTREDVSNLYKDLVIFEMDSNVVCGSNFNQELADSHLEMFANSDGVQKKLYNLCERYYKWISLKQNITSCELDFNFRRWEDISSDFVIINDRELYISLVELYEGLREEACNNFEEKYESCLMHYDTIQKIIKQLEEHETKIKGKC